MASRLEVTSSHGQLIGDMEEHLSMLLGFGCLQTEPIANPAHGLQVWGIFPITELSQKQKYLHFDDNSAQETKTGSFDNCFLDEAAPGHRLWTAVAGWTMPH